MAFLFALVVMLAAGILISVLMSAAIVGAVYGIKRFWGDAWGPTEIGGFDIENPTVPTLQQFALKLVAAVGVPTLALLFFAFLLYYNRTVLRERYWPVWMMWILDAGALYMGLVIFFETDRRKAGVLAAAAMFVYLVAYWLFGMHGLIM